MGDPTNVALGMRHTSCSSPLSSPLTTSEPTSLSAPRLAVSEKFTVLASSGQVGGEAVLPCVGQAHPVPKYRYTPPPPHSSLQSS